MGSREKNRLPRSYPSQDIIECETLFGQVEDTIERKPGSVPSSSRAVAGRDGEGGGCEEVTGATSGQVENKAAENIVASSSSHAVTGGDEESPVPPTATTSGRKKCLTCLDEIQLSFSEKPITQECEHPAGQICKPCLERSLQAQLDELSDQGFTCLLCRKQMSEQDLQTWANPEILHRYDALRTRKALGDNPNFIWCSSLNCERGQIHASGAESPIVTCIYCGARTCFTHQRPWHDEMTCYEFDHPALAIAQEKQERNEKTATKVRPEKQTRAAKALDRKLKAVEQEKEQEIC
ncbi:hypothetical protein BDW59DRAFT_167837 [Aspergillus cavernicola]|uniref:RING-type domain-containing protein n=1 Tax=Aspergillus cavernicola TaxID=176166 RepID=A0ABR4HA43_9EURO